MNYTLGKNDFKIILQYWIRIFHKSSMLIIPNDIYKIIVSYIDIFILSICPHYNPSNMLKFSTFCSYINPKLLVNIGKDLGIKNLNLKNIKIYDKSGDEIKSNNILKNDTIYLSNGLTLESNYYVFRICILGKYCSGKSGVALQYIQGQFVSDYHPFMDDTNRKMVSVDGSTMVIDILDTQEQQDFIALRMSRMRNKDGFVLLFDITNSESFSYLESYYEELVEIYCDNIPPIVLCGNKSDIQQNRQVSKEKAKQFAKKINCCDYIEVSAKTGDNVIYLFSTLIRHILAPLLQNQMSSDKIAQSSKRKCLLM